MSDAALVKEAWAIIRDLAPKKSRKKKAKGKRKASPKQLAALARGRAKLCQLHGKAGKLHLLGPGVKKPGAKKRKARKESLASKAKRYKKGAWGGTLAGMLK